MVSPRLLKTQLERLKQMNVNVNATINEALTQYLRKIDFERITQAELAEISRVRSWFLYSWQQERQKKTLRLMRMHVDAIRMSQYNLTRCIDFALRDWLSEHDEATVTNN